MIGVKCVICGKEVEKSLYSNAVLCSRECFSKNYWNEVVSDPNTIVVEGCCYCDQGYDTEDCGFRGFDGAMFYYRNLKTGKVTKTNNLWLNGGLPDYLKDSIKDTHEFISKEVYDEQSD